MRLPWSSESNNSSTKIQQQSTGKPETRPAEEDIERLRAAWGELCQLSPGTYPLLGLGVSAIFWVGWIAHRRWDSLYSRKFKRIGRHYEVPDSYIRQKRLMKGVPMGYVRSSPISCPRARLRFNERSVSDGDGFLFYHTPGPFWRWPLKFRRVPPTQKGFDRPIPLVCHS